MQSDAIASTKSCEMCQKHGNLIHAPGRELLPSISHWPFQCQAFDLVGQIHPNSSYRHKFIITATNYFTKWVEVVPLFVASGKIVSLFILNYIICIYGVPSKIITNNRVLENRFCSLLFLVIMTLKCPNCEQYLNTNS